MTPALSHAETVAQATEAGRKNREAVIREAHAAYLYDVQQAFHRMTDEPAFVALQDIANCREALRASWFDLDQIEARLPGQRRGDVQALGEGDELATGARR